MERKTIIIRGRVQNVGLRLKIASIADKLGVCGFVENLGNGSVVIECEDERQVLDEMMQQIKAIPEPVAIESMTVETSPATGNMDGFRVLNHEVSDEVTVAIRAGTAQLEVVSNTLEGIDQTLGNMNQTLTSIDQSQQEIVKTQNTMNQTLTSIDQSQQEIVKTQNTMNQTLTSMNDTLVSMNSKMDESLNNDAQILEILRNMRAGSMLQITE